MKRTILIIFILNSVFMSAQVGIGTTTPDSNSILEIESTDKGVLIPRVQLNDVSTAAPLSSPIADGMLIYSDGGTELDGFYYWQTNKWISIGKKPKRTYTVISAGGSSNTPHTMPSDTDKFETYDANWPNPLTLPSATNSNTANRLNEIITIQKRSTFNVTITTTNTDLSANIVLTGSQTAVFLFDGTKWVHIKTSN